MTRFELPCVDVTPGLLDRLRRCADNARERLTVMSTDECIYVSGPNGRELTDLETRHVRASIKSHDVQTW